MGISSTTSVSRRERLRSEIRQEILDAARDLFVKDGYEAVSMRKIADRVGCSPGTLYLYFQDKSAILQAICLETFAKLDKMMERLNEDRTADPLQRLRRGGRQYIQFALDHPQHYLVTFSIQDHYYSTVEKASMQAGLQSFECLKEAVRQCVDAGLTRSTDVDEIAQSLWALKHGLVMLLISESGFPFIERNRLIDSVLDIGIEGIRKH
jgi:AcrR family transcriptional regulator